MAVAITATRTPDGGAPQVGLSITANGPVNIDVSWDEGNTWHGVRGGRIDVFGSEFIRDFVPPLNIRAIYRIVDRVGDTATSAVTIESETAWIQDPLDPRGAVSLHADMEGPHVLLGLGSLEKASRKQAMELVTVDNARHPVAAIGQRLTAADVPLKLFNEIAAEAGKLRNLLDTSGQLVLRGLPTTLLDPVAYVAVGDVDETHYNTADGDFQVAAWDLTVTQVAPLSLRIAAPWWTYDQVRALWAGRTYTQVKSAKPGWSYADWKGAPEP